MILNHFFGEKMAEEASLELKEDAPRAEVLESEDGIYRLYKAAEWNRIQSGREKYPVSMYLMVFSLRQRGVHLYQYDFKGNYASVWHLPDSRGGVCRSLRSTLIS